MLVQWLVDRFVQSKSAGPGWHRSSRSRDETAEKVGYTSLCLAVFLFRSARLELLRKTYSTQVVYRIRPRTTHKAVLPSTYS